MSNDFVQTPLFQLNLLLWLSWFSPSKHITGIEPIFRNEGFDIYAIEPRINLLPEKRLKLQNNNIQVQNNADPDLLLKHSDKYMLLPIECKVSSFGSTSTTSSQANVFLAHSGTEIAEYIGLPNSLNWSSKLQYAVKNGDETPMFTTLNQLASHIRDVGIKPMSFGAIGIEINDEGIFLKIVINDEDDPELIKVKSGKPYFFNLIPADLEQLNEIDKNKSLQELNERLRSALASKIMQNIGKKTFSISEEEIMLEAIEVWEIWQKRQAKKGLLKKSIRPYFREIVTQLQKKGVNVKIEQLRICFENVTHKHSNELSSYFTSNAYRYGDLSLLDNLTQLSMDDIDGFWSE